MAHGYPPQRLVRESMATQTLVIVEIGTDRSRSGETRVVLARVPSYGASRREVGPAKSFEFHSIARKPNPRKSRILYRDLVYFLRINL